MALLIQDDSGGVDGANAYLDVAAFRAYHAARGNDVGAYSDSQVTGAIILACEYLDNRFTFVGEKARYAQRTAWPRIGALDIDELLRAGIPFEVKEAACEYALISLTQELNPSPERDASGRAVQSTSQNVGPISKSVTYTGGAVFQLPKYPKADQKLRGLRVLGGSLSRG